MFSVIPKHTQKIHVKILVIVLNHAIKYHQLLLQTATLNQNTYALTTRMTITQILRHTLAGNLNQTPVVSPVQSSMVEVVWS